MAARTPAPPAGAPATGRPTSRSRAVLALFLGGLLLLLLAVLTQALPLLLPDALAAAIGRNSEGYVVALATAAWLQLARPRLAGGRGWAVVAVASAACAGVAVALVGSDLPSRFVTLNESFAALALVLPYLQVRRPLPRGAAVALSGAVLVVVVLGERTGAVTALAEAFGVLLLLPLATDVAHRRMVDADAPPTPVRTGLWCLLLVVVPVTFSVLADGPGPAGVAGEVVRYGVRVHEAFIGVLLLHALVALQHLSSRRGRAGGAGREQAPSA